MQIQDIKPNPPPAVKPQAAIAVLPWGDLWDDFLDSIGISLEDFCTRGPGGWLLGYIEAWRSINIRTVLFLVSAQVDQVLRVDHAASGATIVVLPAPRRYRAIRSAVDNPYAPLNWQTFLGQKPWLARQGARLVNQVAPYLALPLHLLKQELQQQNCDAIFCQDYESPRFDLCIGLGQWLKIPVFACFQSGTFDPYSIGRKLRPLTLPACAGLVIAPQTEIQRVQTQYSPDSLPIAQIFNPIDVQFWHAVDQKIARQSLSVPLTAEVVVWHGRVEFHSKRLDVLLDAWEQVCRQRPERSLVLLLLGMGQDAERLRQRIAAMSVQNVVWFDRYVTQREEICQFLSTGDVYAFSSSHEGFPVAPIEAMSCGLPIVATEASGIPDILADGTDSGGLRVACGDVDAFAEALGQLLDDPARRQELGRLARRRIETAFSFEAVGQQFAQLFAAKAALPAIDPSRVDPSLIDPSSNQSSADPALIDPSLIDPSLIDQPSVVTHQKVAQ